VHPLLKAWLILLLLAVDWACDPYIGTCPWSAPWASTEAVCQSYSYRADVYRACEPTWCVDVSPPAPADARLPQATPDAPSPGRPAPLSAATRVYALRAIRR
jgi:hypothetical protein